MQDLVNKHFYNLLLFTLTFGIILYDAIGFDYTDEICALLLFTLFGYFLFKTPEWPINKAFLVTLGVFLFYLFYSFYIGSNVRAGILTDFTIQIKPYLAFFCVYSMGPFLTENQKIKLKLLSLFFWLFLLGLGIADIFNPGLIIIIMGHASYFAAAVISVSLCYLYCTNFTLKNKCIFLLMLSAGLVSQRAKFYGFYAFAVVFVFYFSNLKHLKLNVKTVFILCCAFVGIILVAWNKIELYFVHGLNADGEEEDFIARFVLYATSFEIFRDYFPFGSGFGSFATFASGKFYSEIYTQYGIEGVWGISKDFYSYVADTYYPSLAQFGIVGVLLYVGFWLYIFIKAFRFFKADPERQLMYFFIIILITAFFGIEGTSDSTFTTHRGFFILMLLGLTLASMRKSIQTDSVQLDNTSKEDEDTTDQ